MQAVADSHAYASLCRYLISPVSLFVDTNIIGTLNLLEEAVTTGVEVIVLPTVSRLNWRFQCRRLCAPAAWVTEEIRPVPKNIYGVSKAAAEDLCQLFHRNKRLACIVLRTSRFFPEVKDDNKSLREAYSDDNPKLNEFLRRVDLEDVVSAHLLAAKRASAIGFGRYIISATTLPFLPAICRNCVSMPPRAARRRVPDYEAEYVRRGW